jgi:hypothetical protein
LVVLEGVHQAIPDTLVASPGYKLLAPPPDVAGQKAQAGDSSTSVLSTDADRLKQEYKATGEAQNHVYGEGAPGSKPPDFTKLGTVPPGPPKPASAAPAGTAATLKPPGAPASATSPGTPKSNAPTAPLAGAVPGAANASKPGSTAKPGPAGTQPPKLAPQTETTQPRSTSGPDESALPEIPAKPKPRVAPPAVPGSTGATESGTPDPSVLKPRPPAPNPAPPPPPAP